MQNPPPLSESIPSISWSEWFRQVFSALSGWKRSFSKGAVIDFGAVPAQGELSATVAMIGVRPGDMAQVCGSLNAAGLVYAAVVTAKDTVTVYAKNFTASAIDPASTTFRVIVFQN